MDVYYCCYNIILLLIDEVLPEAPKELVDELARRYIMIYEILTQTEFLPLLVDQTTADDAVKRYLLVDH